MTRGASRRAARPLAKFFASALDRQTLRYLIFRYQMSSYSADQPNQPRLRPHRAPRVGHLGRGDPRDDHVDPRHDDRQRRAATRSGTTCTARSRQVQWVITGYLLALAAVIPVTGWAARRFGARQVYLTSLVLFTVGSALCGLSQHDHLAGALPRAAGSGRRDDHAGGA